MQRNKWYFFGSLLLLFNPSFSQNVGNFVKYEKQNADLLIQGTAGTLLIQAFTSDIFKVQVLKPNQARFDSSTCVSLKPIGAIGEVTENAQNWIFLHEN